MKLNRPDGWTLEVQDGGAQWVMTGLSVVGQTITRTYDFNRIPQPQWPLWQTLLREKFQTAKMNNVALSYQAALHLSNWLSSQGITEFTPDELTAEHYGQFVQWMLQQRRWASRGVKPLNGTLSRTTVRSTLTALKRLWHEATVQGVAGVSMRSIHAIADVLLSVTRRQEDEVDRARARNLTFDEAEAVYAALRTEWQRAKAFLEDPPCEYPGYVYRQRGKASFPARKAVYNYLAANLPANPNVRRSRIAFDLSLGKDLVNGAISDLTAFEHIRVLNPNVRPSKTQTQRYEVLSPPVEPPNYRSNDKGFPYPYVTQVDLCAMVAAWLAIDSGLRPHELPQIRLSDVREDAVGHNHTLVVRGQNKPERVIPLDSEGHTIAMLKDLIRWTESARTVVGGDYLFTDWCYPSVAEARIDGHLQARRLNSANLNYHIKNLCRAYNLKRHDGSDLSPVIYDFRHTLGSHLAALGINSRKLQLAMGHTNFRTTKTYYIMQAKVEQSKNVAAALSLEARRLAMAYRTPVKDLETEAPEVAALLRQDPDRDIEYGVCRVEKTGDSLADSCSRAASCLLCPKLVPEARKREAFVQEREQYHRMAEQTNDERTRQQFLTHAALAHGYVLLIDDQVSKQAQEATSQQAAESAPKRRKTYGKKRVETHEGSAD